MSERLKDAPLPQVPEHFTSRMQVDALVLRNKNYAKLPADLQEIAINKAVFFIDASDKIVHDRMKLLYKKELAEAKLGEIASDLKFSDDVKVSQMKTLYQRTGYNSFDRHDKEHNGSYHEIYDIYLDYYNKIKESSETEAKKRFNKEVRREIATREVRVELAEALGYTPGKNGFIDILENNDFRTAATLVDDAVTKFA